MSNHNLFIHRADGTVVSASSQDILAAARTVLAHRVRRGALLQSPEKVGEYLTMRLGHLDYESFGLILVDGRHRVIDCVELFRGTIDGASVYPREVVKLALDKGAAAAVAYHNHPSGVKDQSHADELITKRLAQSLAAVDVKLLDHIVAGGDTTSFAERGRLVPSLRSYLSVTIREAEPRAKSESDTQGPMFPGSSNGRTAVPTRRTQCRS